MHPHSKLIDELGGSVETARLCHVSSQAVSYWRRAGIPEARLMYLRLLRPDVMQHAELTPHPSTRRRIAA